MPVKSYLAYPIEGKKDDLEKSIQTISGCEITPASNHELIIVISDTPNKSKDEEVYQQLLALDSMAHLTLVSGFK